jgi:hypothetical protein
MQPPRRSVQARLDRYAAVAGVSLLTLQAVEAIALDS